MTTDTTIDCTREDPERPEAERLRLPVHDAPVGPHTALLQRRWTLAYTAVWLCSLGILGRAKSERARARAVGLMAPGAGFAYRRRPFAAAASALATVAAFAVWVLVGMMFLPFTVWLAAAWLAGRGRGRELPAGARPAGIPWKLAAVGPLALIGANATQRLKFVRAKRRAPAIDAALARHPYLAPDPATAAPGRGGELTLEQLQFQRYLLDRALQPVDRFDGYGSVDQFRESATRYQLNYSQWALALAQYRCTPAFHGYVEEAQRRLIEKMTNHRVWGYWRWENLWGNLSRDPDPIRTDNIMFSGYLLLMLATYAAVTGDRRYAEPGSLVFDDGRRDALRYDAGAIARVCATNFDCGYGLFPCEPNWVYEGCNVIGFAGLVGHDTVSGTTFAAAHKDRFRASLDAEFTTADGTPITIRASRAGIGVPGIGASTASATAVTFFLSPSLHDVAMRHWLIARERAIGPVFQSPILDRLDVGSYQRTWGPVTYTFALASAIEMGDAEAADAIRESLQRVAPKQLEHGVASYPGTPVTNTMMGIAELGGERAFHDLVAHGIPREQNGWPSLTGAAYPDVLVARAASDGAALELVLRPGDGARRVVLGVERLLPGRSYDVRGPAAGATVTADPRGHATLEVDLADRTELSVVPSA